MTNERLCKRAPSMQVSFISCSFFLVWTFGSPLVSISLMSCLDAFSPSPAPCDQSTRFFLLFLFYLLLCLILCVLSFLIIWCHPCFFFNVGLSVALSLLLNYLLTDVFFTGNLTGAPGCSSCFFSFTRLCSEY